MEIDFGVSKTPPPPKKTPINTQLGKGPRQPLLDLRIRYQGRLGKLLREFESHSYILLDGDEGISFVPTSEVRKI